MEEAYLRSALQDVDGGDVLVGGNDGENDGALLGQVAVDQAVHFLDYLARAAGGGEKEEDVERIVRGWRRWDREEAGAALATVLCWPWVAVRTMPGRSTT